MKQTKLNDDIPEGHAFAETTDRFPLDTVLRRAGWRIHSRPSKGEAEWEKDGRMMKFSDAVETLGTAHKVFEKKRGTL